ncbi:MAG: hypothetical protein KGM24_14885, partial [Elusimicrobia bacterium]|nr:hypothetical protein [Elusimicrobiota bacterium]
PSPWRTALNAVAALAGVAGAAYGIWHWRVARSPEVAVPKLAARYLDDLRAGDVAGAYAMFSDAAKSSCSLADFRASRATETWTWSDLRIEHIEPGAVLMAYDLQVSGEPPRVDHLLFTQENGRWTRPYNWTLMQQVEKAFDNGDPDKGLILAQEAATVDPRDPMAWGYLCEAAYYRKAPAVAQTRCEKAIELARTYPSDLSLKSLYHLHAILADIANNSLHQPEKALEQFAEMLSFPQISPADQCQILLARSQTYIALSRPGEALADLDRGAQLCSSPQDLQFIQDQRRRLGAPDAQ